MAKPKQLRAVKGISEIATANSSGKPAPISLPEPVVKGDTRISYVTGENGEVRVKVDQLFQHKPLASFLQTPLEEFSESEFDDFIEYNEKLGKIRRNAMAFVRKYEKSDGAGFYFYSSSPGSGKTMLACIIAASTTREHNVSSQAISVIDLMKRIRSTIKTDISERAIINPMLSAKVLVLDELGAEKRSEFTEEVLYEIVDYRLNRRKTTLFTSNLPVVDLPYHSRLLSRIRRMSMLVPLPDIDVRFRLAARRDEELQTALGEEG